MDNSLIIKRLFVRVFAFASIVGENSNNGGRSWNTNNGTKDRKYQFWERNPLSVDLYSRKVVLQKLDYVHANPLSGKWNLAHSPLDYWFSSYRFYETGIDDFGFLTHYLEDC